ncbi:hypothetical protein [Paenibacillus germinis]|nr:hypothetical protein [Paenibacillus germinis]
MKYPCLDAALPVGKRVTDLLGRMMTDEKIGQLIQLFGWKACWN